MKLTKKQVQIRSYYFAKYVADYFAVWKNYPNFSILRNRFQVATFNASLHS